MVKAYFQTLRLAPFTMAVWRMNRKVDLPWQSTNKRSLETVMLCNIAGLFEITRYHNWAEVYFDGAWRLLDAQKEQWLSPAEDYVAFRFYRDKEDNPIGLAHRYSQSGELEIRF